MSRKRSLPLADAHGIICHIAFMSGHRGIDLSRRLYISGSGVTVAARRGKELVAKSPKLKAIVDQVVGKVFKTSPWGSQKEGKQEVARNVNCYNLDAFRSVNS